MQLAAQRAPSSAAPASIIACAHAPWATMWIVEFVKKTITGHISTPRPKSERSARGTRARRGGRQTSSPTIASREQAEPEQQEAGREQPVDVLGRRLHQLLPASRSLDQRPARRSAKTTPTRDHQQRRLDEEPPEALAVRVQQRHPVGLQERPDDAAQHRERAERQTTERGLESSGRERLRAR